MKRKIIALLLCIVCVVSLCFPVAADDDGYSAIVSDIDKTCPTCGAALHASWGSTSGAEVELEISDTGKVKIPAGAGAFARIHLRCSSCGYEKTETRLLGLDFGAEKPGKLVEAPSGIGRKDLPGYADDNGTPSVGSTGAFQVVAHAVYNTLYYANSAFNTSWFSEGNYISSDGSFYLRCSQNSIYVCSTIHDGKSRGISDLYYTYMFDAPVDGLYYCDPSTTIDGYWNHSNLGVAQSHNNVVFSEKFSSGENQRFKKYGAVTITAGEKYGNLQIPYSYTIKVHDLILNVIPDTVSIKQYSKITINNNTWNGNIYTDNSTNLTYIYPQYTTVNEKNETVTNISNTPIIYNNETKQYYTYDQTTKNYYYITYNSDPAPSPTPTPAPTDKPGGDISTPETGKPGNSSGSSWWDKLLSKIGDAIIDGLLGAVSAVLKLIFKLFSTILSWIIWAVSRVFDLLPFLPSGLGGLLVGGVVVCFVIGIIKFIRG